MYDDEPKPILAFLLTLIGAILMIVEGIFLTVVGSAAGTAGFASAATLLGDLGFLGGLFGFIVLLLAIALFRNPYSHVGYGIAILILSLLSLFGGGGFILGLILGMVGGIMAIIFSPEQDDLPPSLAPVPDPTRGSTTCTNCHFTNLPGATVCSVCELPLPRATVPSVLPPR